MTRKDKFLLTIQRTEDAETFPGRIERPMHLEGPFFRNFLCRIQHSQHRSSISGKMTGFITPIRRRPSKRTRDDLGISQTFRASCLVIFAEMNFDVMRVPCDTGSRFGSVFLSTITAKPGLRRVVCLGRPCFWVGRRGHGPKTIQNVFQLGGRDQGEPYHMRCLGRSECCRRRPMLGTMSCLYQSSEVVDRLEMTC